MATAKTKTSAEQVQQSATEFTQKGLNERVKLFEEFSAFNKGNWDAFTKASQVATKALQDMGENFANLQKDAMNSIADTTKAFQDAKSIQDVMEIQANQAKLNLNKLANEQAKMTEQLVKVSSEMTEPLSNRFNAAVEAINARVKA